MKEKRKKEELIELMKTVRKKKYRKVKLKEGIKREICYKVKILVLTLTKQSWK